MEGIYPGVRALLALYATTRTAANAGTLDPMNLSLWQKNIFAYPIVSVRLAISVN